MRRTIFLLTMIGMAFLLASGVALVLTAGPDESSVAEAQTPAAKNAQPEVSTGVFHVQWGDPPGRDLNAEAKSLSQNYPSVDDESSG